MSKDLPGHQSKAKSVNAMFNRIAPRYDLMNRILSAGMDMRWRREAVKALALPSGSLVIDAGCGTGDFVRLLDEGGMRVVGVDPAERMLRAARTNAPLICGDALALPVADGTVDGITCGWVIRNVADVKEMFSEFGRVLRAGGRLAALEIAEPRSAFVAAGHKIWFNRVAPLVGGLISDREAYRYLPKSIQYLPTHEEMVEMLSSAGFIDIKRRDFMMGAIQLITATRR